MNEDELREVTPEEYEAWLASVGNEDSEEEPGELSPQEQNEIDEQVEYLRRFMYDAPDLEHLPLPVWQVDEFLVDGSLTYLAGEPGHGKSFVAVSIACCIATGRTWYGRPTRPAKVLYIAAEGVLGVAKRVRAWKHENGQEIEPGRLRLLGIPVQINNSVRWQALRAILAEDEYGLVVIDTQARMTNGKDENSQQDMSPVIALLEELRLLPKQPTVLVVHHSPKAAGEPRLRGSSALTGACEAIIGVKRTYSRKKSSVPNPPNQTPTKIEVSCQRQKDAEEFDDIYFDLIQIDLGSFNSAVLRPGKPFKKPSTPVPVAVRANAEDAKKLARHLTAVPGGPGAVIDLARQPAGITHAQAWREALGDDWVSAADICRAVGKDSFSSIRRALERAKVFLEQDGGAGTRARYRLTEASLDWLDQFEADNEEDSDDDQD